MWTSGGPFRGVCARFCRWRELCRIIRRRQRCSVQSVALKCRSSWWSSLRSPRAAVPQPRGGVPTPEAPSRRASSYRLRRCAILPPQPASSGPVTAGNGSFGGTTRRRRHGLRRPITSLPGWRFARTSVSVPATGGPASIPRPILEAIASDWTAERSTRCCAKRPKAPGHRFLFWPKELFLTALRGVAILWV